MDEEEKQTQLMTRQRVNQNGTTVRAYFSLLGFRVEKVEKSERVRMSRVLEPL